MFIRLSNEEYPINLGVIRTENPRVSFAATLTDENLQPYGFANVNKTDKPAYNTDTQRLVEGAPTNDGSQWNQTWTAVNLTLPQLKTNLDRAVAIKQAEADIYADALIDSAYSSPTTTTTENPKTYRRVVKARERDNGNKIAGEIALNQTQIDQAKVDRKLSEYDGKVHAANDKAYSEIDKKDYASEVEALVISTITTWPVWVAPV